MLREEELRMIVDCWFADHEGDNVVLVNEEDDEIVVLEDVDYEWEDMTIHINNLKIEVDEVIELMSDQLVIGNWVFDIM